MAPAKSKPESTTINQALIDKSMGVKGDPCALVLTALQQQEQALARHIEEQHASLRQALEAQLLKLSGNWITSQMIGPASEQPGGFASRVPGVRHGSKEHMHRQHSPPPVLEPEDDDLNEFRKAMTTAGHDATHHEKIDKNMFHDHKMSVANHPKGHTAQHNAEHDMQHGTGNKPSKTSPEPPKAVPRKMGAQASSSSGPKMEPKDSEADQPRGKMKRDSTISMATEQRLTDLTKKEEKKKEQKEDKQARLPWDPEEPGVHDGSCQGRAKMFIAGPQFDMISGFLVIANSICMFVSLEHAGYEKFCSPQAPRRCRHMG